MLAHVKRLSGIHAYLKQREILLEQSDACRLAEQAEQ